MEEPRGLAFGGRVSGLDMVWGYTMTQMFAMTRVPNRTRCDKTRWRPACVVLMSLCL